MRRFLIAVSVAILAVSFAACDVDEGGDYSDATDSDVPICCYWGESEACINPGDEQLDGNSLCLCLPDGSWAECRPIF